MSAPEYPKRITGRAFLQALIDAGIVRGGEVGADGIAGGGDYVRRVIIDAGIHDAVVVYVERYGDERLLQVAATLKGIQVTSVPAPEAAKEANS